LSPLVENEKVLVIRTQRKGAVSNQTLNRNNGFLQYIKEKQLENKLGLINVEFKDDNEDANLEILRAVFASQSNIKAAITFNSKVYRLAMHLEALNHLDVKLIGYDLLEQNVAFLKQDVISFLIAQRPNQQAYFTVRDMCRKLIFKQEIKKINYVPIDILLKDNIEDYMNFTE
jgi:LacI family transcriptional regulator